MKPLKLDFYNIRKAITEDLGRWNNAKRHEEADRVKHGVTDDNDKT